MFVVCFHFCLILQHLQQPLNTSKNLPGLAMGLGRCVIMHRLLQHKGSLILGARHPLHHPNDDSPVEAIPNNGFVGLVQQSRPEQLNRFTHPTQHKTA